MVTGHESPVSKVLGTLLANWRTEAANLRGWGARGQAEAVERCAAQLDAVLADDGAATKGGSRA